MSVLSSSSFLYIFLFLLHHPSSILPSSWTAPHQRVPQPPSRPSRLNTGSRCRCRCSRGMYRPHSHSPTSRLGPVLSLNHPVSSLIKRDAFIHFIFNSFNP